MAMTLPTESSRCSLPPLPGASAATVPPCSPHATSAPPTPPRSASPGSQDTLRRQRIGQDPAPRSLRMLGHHHPRLLRPTQQHLRELLRLIRRIIRDLPQLRQLHPVLVIHLDLRNLHDHRLCDAHSIFPHSSIPISG